MSIQTGGGRTTQAGTTRPPPLITVATVVFNGADLIEQAIDSVRKHRCEGLEYIVIDGGSTDGTVDVLRRRSSDIDFWVSEPDGGIYEAMNKALGLAKGRWILFLGADDEIVTPLSEVASRLLDDQAIYYGDVRYAVSGERYGGVFSISRLMCRNNCHQAIFYPRSVYSRKPYDPGAGILADYQYNIELWAEPCRFVHLPILVSHFNECGASSRNTAYFRPMKHRIIRRNFGIGWYAWWRIGAALRFITRTGYAKRGRLEPVGAKPR